MGRFVTRLLPYQRHKISNYEQADVERNSIELVAPRSPFAYTAPVVVLVNNEDWQHGSWHGDRTRRHAESASG